MMKLVEVTEAKGEGLEALLGERVLLICLNYHYNGKLIGVGSDFVLIEDPAIVYETGPWNDSRYKDAQKLPAKVWHVKRSAIESFGVGL